MARVNLERRAEIGREKRARTRAAILEAARACYAVPGAPQVTIDEVTRAAGVAKGTFYVHFTDLNALEAELGDAIIETLAGLHDAVLTHEADPLTRMATVATIFLRDLAQAPAQARLVTRAIAELPDFAQAVQERLRGDLAEAAAGGQLAPGILDLAPHIVVSLVAEGAQLLGAGRFDSAQLPELLRAILRALGAAPESAAKRVEAAGARADAIIGQRQG